MSRPPQPTPDDMALWRALVAAARGAMASPGRGPLPGLSKAAFKARRQAVVLAGPAREDHPCVRLVRLSLRYADETRAGRQALRADLLAAAHDVTALLEPPPPARPRADIFG